MAGGEHNGHRPRVGVLAIQGDFDAHARALERAGASPVLVKHREELSGLDGLVLPGGESTTVLKFLSNEGLMDAIRVEAEKGLPVFGTCAGAILLARDVSHPSQASLGLMDIGVRRNAYGRQVSSFIQRQPLAAGQPEQTLEMVFIRAPIIERVGKGVQVLAQCNQQPVLVRQGHLLASTFHPELSSDSWVHKYFLDMVRSRPAR